MPSAPRPADETFRLRSLQDLDILDTPPDPSFDVYPALAAEIFGMPVSAISFLDADRQWFKAAQGLRISETPRDVSFCAHAILRPDQVLYVPDATLDDRFAENPFVTGDTNLRFYAGAPVLSPGGYPVGVICITDTHPHTLTEGDLAQLQLLARGVGTSLHLHRTLNRLSVAAVTDTLTGALNRRGFRQATLRRRNERALVPAEDEPDSALIGVDIQGLKAVNDRFGEAGGDAVLMGVAQRLRDAVGESDLVARLGSDEFAVFLHEIRQPAQLTRSMRKIQDLLAIPFVIQGSQLRIEVSIGLATVSADELQATCLLAMADGALQAARRPVSQHRPN